jgi:hypothetical protein
LSCVNSSEGADTDLTQKRKLGIFVGGNIG